jgi:hypothetical protein
MNERLEALRHGPWSADFGYKVYTLDGYPIGTVLHLSRQFVEVANTIRSVGSRAHSHMETSEPVPDLQLERPSSFASTHAHAHAHAHAADQFNLNPSATHSQRPTASSSRHLDLPAVFILTSCSFMLIQLFDIVLTHLQNYLRAPRDDRARSAAATADSLESAPTRTSAWMSCRL